MRHPPPADGVPICARCGPTRCWRTGHLLSLRCAHCGGRLLGTSPAPPAHDPPAVHSTKRKES